MKFLVITKIPGRPGFPAAIKQKIAINEIDAPDIDMLKNRLNTPLGGVTYIVPKEYVVIIKSRVVNEIVHEAEAIEVPSTLEETESP
jgi:hypothetical protein